MTRAALLAASALVVACGSRRGGGAGDGGPPAPPTAPNDALVEHATLLDVATDQSFLAYDGPPAKGFGSDDLYAHVFSSGRDVHLAEGDKARGAEVVGSTLLFGFDSAWWPDLEAPIAIGDAFSGTAVSSDGMRIAFWHSDTARHDAGTVQLIRRDRCAGGTCEPSVLVRNVPGPILSFSPDGRSLLDLTLTSTRSASVALLDIETASLRPLGEIAESTRLEIPQFTADGSELFAVATSTDGSPHLRRYAVPSGVREDWPGLPPGWIFERELLDDSHAIAIFEGLATRGYDIEELDRDHATPLAHLAGTSQVYLVGAGLVLEIGGDVDDHGRARLFDFRRAGSAPIPLSDHFVEWAAVSASVDRFAFLENGSGTENTAALTIVSIPSGARTTIARAVPSGIIPFVRLPLVVLRGSDEVLYVDSADTLHRWRSDGSDTVVAEHVFNFRLIGDRVYCTINVGKDFSLDDASIVELPLP